MRVGMGQGRAAEKMQLGVSVGLRAPHESWRKPAGTETRRRRSAAGVGVECIHGCKRSGRGQNWALIGLFLFSRAAFQPCSLPFSPRHVLASFSFPYPLSHAKTHAAHFCSLHQSCMAGNTRSRHQDWAAHDNQTYQDLLLTFKTSTKSVSAFHSSSTNSRCLNLAVVADIFDRLAIFEGPLDHVVSRAPVGLHVCHWLLCLDVELLAARTEPRSHDCQ